jgi:hypothetical protein
MVRAGKVAIWGALLAACGGEGGTGGDPCTAWPEAPAGAVVHVSACGDDGGDGSVDAPFRTLGPALASAAAGATIVLAPGRYEGSLVVDDAVTIAGAGADATHLVAADGEPGIVANADLTLRGVAVEGATVAGVWLRGAEATLEDCAVRGTRASADGEFGFGVLAVEESALTMTRCALTENAGPGLLVHTGQATVDAAVVSDNGGAGIRFEQPGGDVSVRGSEVRGNVESGIAVFGGRGIILQNRVTGTRPGRGGSADGIVVAALTDEHDAVLAEAEARIAEDNEVEDNARAGILVGGGARGIILQNYVAGNARAGVWLQEHAEVQVERNRLERNAFVGIAATGGAHGIILQNFVADTRMGEDQQGLERVTVGDAIGLFDEARAEVSENDLRGSARAALVADGVTGEIAGNRLEGNARGIILQNLPHPDDVMVDTAFEHLEGEDLVGVLADRLDARGSIDLPH